MMENEVNTRVLMLKTHLRLTDIEFCNAIGVSTGTLHRIKNNSEISNKVLYLILDKLNVSKNWLLKGEGDMFNPETDNIYEVKEVASNPWKDALVSQLKDENSFLKDQIKMMREMLQVLKPTANFPSRDVLAGTIYANSMGISVSA